MPRSPFAPRRPAARALACAAWILGWALAAALPATAATLDVSGPPGATLRVNGLDLGTLPLAGPLTLGAGTYLVEGDLAGCRPFARTVRLDESSHAHLMLRFERLSRRTAWTSSVLYAGLGQFYVGKPVRGWIYAAAETGGLLTALAGELQRSNLRKDYLVLKGSYDAAINANEVIEFRRLAGLKYAEMEDAEKVRDLGLIVALAAVGISVADALLTFPAVDAGPGPVPALSGRAPELPGDRTAGLTAVHAAVKLTF
ncbi:MAG: hypothetical protein ABR506_04595 [Candidatus Krumholzibacteriia bacterium]